MGSSEISEWMAYDLTNDDAWIKKYNTGQEFKKQNENPSSKKNLFKKLISGE